MLSERPVLGKVYIVKISQVYMYYMISVVLFIYKYGSNDIGCDWVVQNTVPVLSWCFMVGVLAFAVVGLFWLVLLVVRILALLFVYL